MDSLTAKAELQRNYLFRGLSESIIDELTALASCRECVVDQAGLASL